MRARQRLEQWPCLRVPRAERLLGSRDEVLEPRLDGLDLDPLDEGPERRLVVAKRLREVAGVIAHRIGQRGGAIGRDRPAPPGGGRRAIAGDDLPPIASQTVRWWRVVEASPSPKARLRELGDEAAEALAIELAGPEPDGVARLMAGMIVLTVYTALKEAVRVLEPGGSAKKANAALFALMDRGLDAVEEMTRKTST